MSIVCASTLVNLCVDLSCGRGIGSGLLSDVRLYMPVLSRVVRSVGGHLWLYRYLKTRVSGGWSQPPTATATWWPSSYILALGGGVPIGVSGASASASPVNMSISLRMARPRV